MMTPAIHVQINLDGRWCVRKGGETKAVKCFDIKMEALDFGRRFACRERLMLYLHRRDGQVQKREDYTGA